MRYLRSFLHVLDLNAQSGWCVCPEHAHGVFHIDECECGIEFKMTGLEYAGDCELFQARQYAGGRDLPLRNNDCQFVSGADAQHAGQFLADGDVEGVRLQITQFAGNELAGDFGDPGFFFRFDAAHDYATHRVVAGDQCLTDDIRGCSGHFRVLPDCFGCFPPVGKRSVNILDFDVRQDRQHPVADFFLEAVHDGHDDNQGSDAQCDACHRYPRNE